MPVTLVAAVARNGVIGADGGIPWRLPGELATFKATTMGHVLVMGRRTYDSIGRPLPGRSTVVVTSDATWAPNSGMPDGVAVATSVESALELARAIDEQVFVVGGARVYADSLPYADQLVITEVDAAPEGDTYFPKVDWNDWREVGRESYDGWQLVTYRRGTARMGYRCPHGD